VCFLCGGHNCLELIETKSRYFFLNQIKINCSRKVLEKKAVYISRNTNVISNNMSPIHPYTFFFDLPLYTSIEITSENKKEFFFLMSGNYTIDAYNPALKQETTYTVSIGNIYGRETGLNHYIGSHQFDIKCVRNGYTIKTYLILICEEDEKGEDQFNLVKVGQHPSIADLHISKVRNYDKVLDKEKIKEITRAIGLAANGVGIGSFVYLRRVFEHLIEEAHQLALSDNKWNEEQFKKNKVVERIEQLSHHLPEFLVKNKSIYGILSVGIHSLNENDCLKYFDAIKVGIELMLDEKLEKLNRLKKIEEAQNRIQTITQMVNKK
jgi:hypothetical protein